MLVWNSHVLILFEITLIFGLVGPIALELMV